MKSSVNLSNNSSDNLNDDSNALSSTNSCANSENTLNNDGFSSTCIYYALPILNYVSYGLHILFNFIYKMLSLKYPKSYILIQVLVSLIGGLFIFFYMSFIYYYQYQYQISFNINKQNIALGCSFFASLGNIIASAISKEEKIIETLSFFFQLALLYLPIISMSLCCNPIFSSNQEKMKIIYVTNSQTINDNFDDTNVNNSDMV